MAADFARIREITRQPRVAAREIGREEIGRSQVRGAEGVQCVLSVLKSCLHVLNDGRGGGVSLGPGLDSGGGDAGGPGDAISREKGNDASIPGEPNDITQLKAPIDESAAAHSRVCHGRIEKERASRGLGLEGVVRVERITPWQAERYLTAG